MDLPVLKGVEQVSDGWLKKYVLAYDLPDGRELNYEVVSRKGLEQYGAEIRGEAAAEPSTDAVCIVGHTADDAFLLIREETGYDLVRNEDGSPANARTCLQPGYSSLGMGDESIAMVFAEVERVCEPRAESTEFIESFELPRTEVEQFLRENTDPLSIRCQLVLEMIANPLFV